MSKLKNVKVLTTAAMLTAVAIILGFFKIPLTQLIEIRFGWIPIAVAGSMLGPVAGAVVGGLADIGGYLVKPTGPFFPGFTISGIISGLIYGFFLYKKEASILRFTAAEAVKVLIVGILLNTYWLSVLYGNPFYAVLITRIPKELIMLPIDIAIMTLVLKPVSKMRLNYSL